MNITVMTPDEQIVTLEVDRDESVENLKALLEIESRVPLQQQQLLYNGREMRNAETLSGLGVADGDLMMMMVSNAASSRASTNEVGLNNGRSTRLILPCTDDNGKFMCFLCQKYLESGHTLYQHMRCHTSSDWRDVLPETLENYTEIDVRKALLTSHNDQYLSDDDVSINEEQVCDGSTVDLTMALPRWNATGKVKDKRGRQDLKKYDVVVEVGSSGKKDAVVFDFDLNDDAMIETEDEIYSRSTVCYVDA